jgi:hypothetical protein
MVSQFRIPLFERLLIESQSDCNRSCWFCSRTYDRSGKYRDEAGQPVRERMSTEKILDLLDQALELGFQGLVTFHHFSEPLRDERNIRLAQEARERGMKPYIHTNGDELKRDKGLCRAIGRIYEFIVLGLYDYETDDELEKAKSYWRSRLVGANLRFSPIGLVGARSAHSIGTPRALVPSDSRMAIPDLTYAHAPCHRPLIRMIIQYDGTMVNCCEDIRGAFNLGSVFENGLKVLWFSEQHVRVLEDLVCGQRDQYDLCRNCPQPPTGPAPDGTKIEIAPRHYLPVLRDDRPLRPV